MSHEKRVLYRIDVIGAGQTFVDSLPMDYTDSLFVVAKVLKESWEKISEGDRVLIIRMCAECHSEETILDVQAKYLEELMTGLAYKRAFHELCAILGGQVPEDGPRGEAHG